jgi:hypothetical protein
VNVLGFGGGVSELFLQLAKSEGHDAYFCAGSPERRDALRSRASSASTRSSSSASSRRTG